MDDGQDEVTAEIQIPVVLEDPEQADRLADLRASIVRADMSDDFFREVMEEYRAAWQGYADTGLGMDAVRLFRAQSSCRHLFQALAAVFGTEAYNMSIVIQKNGGNRTDLVAHSDNTKLTQLRRMDTMTNSMAAAAGVLEDVTVCQDL